MAVIVDRPSAPGCCIGADGLVDQDLRGAGTRKGTGMAHASGGEGAAGGVMTEENGAASQGGSWSVDQTVFF